MSEGINRMSLLRWLHPFCLILSRVRGDVRWSMRKSTSILCLYTKSQSSCNLSKGLCLRQPLQFRVATLIVKPGRVRGLWSFGPRWIDGNFGGVSVGEGGFEGVLLPPMMGRCMLISIKVSVKDWSSV